MRVSKEDLLFLIFILAFPIVSIYSQQSLQIHGNVRDVKAYPLPYVHVIACEINSEKILAFTTTDESGYYEISLDKNNQTHFIIFSSIGYTSDTLFFANNPTAENIRYDPILDQATYGLEAIEIKESHLPFRESGDTVSFRADFYSDGTEENVEELIKKMPGVKVNDHGEIFFKGKRVDKVLLEDDELFGRKYTVGTRNMDATIVDEIQFVDHYLENRLLHGIKESEKMAMNISLKKERKRLIFGSIEPGVGLPGKADMNLNLFSLQNQFKLFVPANGNNIGKSAFSLDHYLKGTISLNEPYDYTRPARYFIEDQIINIDGIPDKLFKLDHRAVFGGMNAILELQENIKLKLYGISFYEKYKHEHSLVFEDLNFQEEPGISEMNFLFQKSNGWESHIEIQWQLSDDSNLYLKNTFHRSDILDIKNHILEKEQHELSLSQELQSANDYQKLNLSYTNRISKNNVFILDASLYKDLKPQFFKFEPHPGFIKSSSNDFIIQNNRHLISDFDIRSSILGKIKDGTKYAIHIQVQGQKDSLSSRVDAISIGPLEFNLDNKFCYLNTTIMISGGVWKFLGKTRIHAQLEATRKFLKTIDHGSINGQVHKDNLNLSLGIMTKLNKRWTISSQYQMSHDIAELKEIFPASIFTSYRRLSAGSALPELLPRHKIYLISKYSNNLSLLEITGSVFYRYRSQNYGTEYIYSDGFTWERRKLLGNASLLNAGLDMDKYITGLSCNLGLGIQFNQSEYPMSSKDLQRIRLENIIGEMSLTTAWSGPLDLGVVGRFNTSEYLVIGEDKSFNHRRTHLKYNLNLKPSDKLNLKINVNQNTLITKEELESISFWLAELRLSYRIRPGFQCNLIVNNLFDQRKYRIEHFGASSFNLESYSLQSRYFVVYADISF